MKIVITTMSSSFGAFLVGCATPVDTTTQCDKDYDAIVAQQLADFDAAETVIRRIVLGEIAEEELTENELALIKNWETLQADHSRPVDQIDLAVLDRAQQILSDSSVWDREDDRQCEESDTTFSLYCALYFATIDVVGTYQHRRTALQEVRFAIDEARPGVGYDHRLQGFNNASDTTFADVKRVIKTAKSRVQERLEMQADCAL